MSERKISIPPPNSSIAVGGGLSFASVLAWLVYMFFELQTGQARIEERVKAIEARLPPASIVSISNPKKNVRN